MKEEGIFNSTCRVIWINKKPIPTTNIIIDTINKQAPEEQQGIKFGAINMRTTTVNDCEDCGNDSDY